MADLHPEPTKVALSPIRWALGELAFAGVLLAMGWGVVWLIEWADRAPAWIALIYVTLGRQGVFAVFAMFAVFAALTAPDHLEEGGWRRSATIVRLLVLAAVIAEVVHWFTTGHTTLGVLGAVLAILVALIARRDTRRQVPDARAAQVGGR
jgi:hypothetical protein